MRRGRALAPHPGPRVDDTGRTVVSLRAVAYAAEVPVHTLRRRTEPVACDVATRSHLLDLEAVSQWLDALSTGGSCIVACGVSRSSAVPHVRPHPEPGPRCAFCAEAAVEGAPLPICPRHLVEVVRWGTSTSVLRAVTPTPGPDAALREPKRAVVYYLRVGNLVKIGTTGRLQQRVAQYPPHAVLLASEPGGEILEAERLRQFAPTRAHGREWFHPSAELIGHINSLRDTPLTAADLAA